MYKSSKFAAVIMGIVCMLLAIPSVHGQDQNKSAKSDGAFDPIEFIKRFKTGMSYSEVQASLPKNVEQDAPAYITSQEVFLLNVSLPGAGDWSATFKFDTLEDAARRPEMLIELSCSAGLSSRGESFDTIVRKVTDAFGEVHGAARTFLGTRGQRGVTLALNAGGQKVFGDTYPFFESAFIGGKTPFNIFEPGGGASVRGLPAQRYAGDASAFGGAELYLPITKAFLLVPGNLGLMGFYDIGRVFLDGERIYEAKGMKVGLIGIGAQSPT